jgi:DNA (cytosine-5)-methyltransferase 1
MQYFNNKPIRLIELFAGIGSQAKALKNIGVDFEHWRVCEFDNHAINSYNAVHGTNFATSDITELIANDLGITDTDTYTYLLTYSFPCQDLSTAGLGRGMEKGSGTRSGLLWEVERLLEECEELPQVLLMENVPQVHGKKNKEHFDKWIEFLESKGYSNFWQDLNAKDYGIPQNRNRCFMVSILGDYTFEFPKPIPLTLTLKDMLETEVDEKYYLSNKAIQGSLNTNYNSGKIESRVEKNGVIPTLRARDYKDPKLVIEEGSKCQAR